MQILFDNWEISVEHDAPIVQGDNLSEPVTVEGRLPDGYSSWSLILSAKKQSNVISLGLIDGKPGVYLTSEMLPYGNISYAVQLRGEYGDVIKHSHIAYFNVYPSAAGDGTWPEVATEFSQSEARIREFNAHPPVPDDDGEYWAVWDTDDHEYVVSEYPLPPVAEAPAPARGTDYWTSEDQQSIVNDVLAELPCWTGGSY